MKYSTSSVARLVQSRESICSDIVKKAADSEAYYLAGLPRVGKTFVLTEAKRRLKEMPGMQVCTVDLKEFSERPNLEYEIWHKVSLWINRKLSVWQKLLMTVRGYKNLSIEKTGSSALDELYAWMDKFQALKNARFNKMTLMFLNFDRCVGFGDSKSFINDVTFLLGKCNAYDIGVVFESRQSFDMIERRTTCSFPTGKKACLLPIGDDEIANYLRLCGHPELCERSAELLNCSCGIPYLIDQCCQNFEGVRMERCSYFKKLSGFLKFIKEDVDFQEDGVECWYDVLVQREAYPESANPSPLFRESLEFYGLGAKTLPKEFSLFGKYLRENLRARDMQKEIDDVERSFRYLISRKLENYYGQKDWFSALEIPLDEDWGLRTKSRRPFVVQIRSKLKSDRPGLAPVQKMDLQDLCCLMKLKRHWEDDGSRKWKGFMRWFDGDDKRCKWAFSSVIACRNRVDHANDPEDDCAAEYQRAAAYMRGTVLPLAKEDVERLFD